MMMIFVEFYERFRREICLILRKCRFIRFLACERGNFSLKQIVDCLIDVPYDFINLIRTAAAIGFHRYTTEQKITYVIGYFMS